MCEASDFLLEFNDFLVEFALLLLHLVDHLVFFFLEFIALELDNFMSFAWRSIEFPLLIIIVIFSEFVAELFKDSIGLHSHLDLAFELFDLVGDAGDELTDGREFFNVVGGPVDHLVDVSELLHRVVGLGLRLLRDHFHQSVSDLGVFSDEHLTDVVAVNSEHADDN